MAGVRLAAVDGGKAAVDRGKPAAAEAPSGRARRFLGEHGGLLVLLVLGGVVRALAVAAYVPAFFFPDSISYLEVADTGEAQVIRTWGYSGLLALLDGLVPFQAVVVVQHALGLLAAVLVYALLRRRGVGRLVRCLAAAPLVLDGYLIQIEHYVLAESLYVFLLVSAIVLLLWYERPPWWAASGAGVLLAAGAITRTVGLFVLGVVAVYLLVALVRRRLSWLAATGAALGVAAVLLPYMAWVNSSTGEFTLTNYSGHFLYGRVSTFVDCARIDVPTRLQDLCPTEPVGERPGSDFHVWDVKSPANSGEFSEDDLMGFALLVVRAQPLDFAATTASSTIHYFLPGRSAGSSGTCVELWKFPRDAERYRVFRCEAQLAPAGFGMEPVLSFDRPPIERVLAGYQDWVHVPGPVQGLLLVVALSGLIPHRRRGAGRDALDGVLCAAIALALVVVPSATSVFDYRYGLPVLAVLPVGAALATRGWWARGQEPRGQEPASEEPGSEEPGSEAIRGQVVDGAGVGWAGKIQRR